MIVMEHRKQLRLLTFLCLLMGVSGTCDSRHCRTVSTAEELGDALMNEVVQNITIKGMSYHRSHSKRSQSAPCIR